MITAKQTYYCGQKDQHVTLRYLLFEPVNFLYKVNSLILVDIYYRFKSFE